MKPFPGIALLALFLAVTAAAEDPLSSGIRGALNVISGVPEHTASVVRSNAAELLSRYVKVRDGNHLIQLKSGAGGAWVETHGLRFGNITAQPVTMADKANGVIESYFVSVDADMHRTYDGKATKWSEWTNGLHVLFPHAVKVSRGPDNQWTAQTSSISFLVPFTAHGNPALIPNAAEPVSRAGIPSTTANPSALPSLAPKPAPARADKPEPISRADGPAARMAGNIFSLAILLIAFAVVMTLFGTLFAKRHPRSSRARSGTRNHPPPIPSSIPPQAPEAPAAPEIDLIEGRTHLLTPAEQAFFSVLEPIVRHACSISTKVRLADLFAVVPGRGQQAAFNKISRKHIDFVLTEPATSRILCAIELDDSSHNRPDRIERDDFVNHLFAANGMTLLRVPVSWSYNLPGLRTELLKAGIAL